MTQAQQLADLSQAYTAGALGWRNRIIGGCCRIAQRPAIAVTQANGGGVYGGPDHFQCYNLGTAANGQFTQSQSSINFNNVMRPAVQQNVDTPIVSFVGPNSLWGGFVNRIEGYDCFDLMGRTTMLSFVYFSNVPGVHSVAVLVANYSFVSTFTSTGVPQYVTIPLPAMPLDAGIPTSVASGISVIIDRLCTGATATANLNVWQPGVFTNATTQVNWGATGNNWNLLAELQFEPGTIWTPFERRPVMIEQALCRRFTLTLNGLSLGITYNSTYLQSGSMLFPTTMRTAPVLMPGATYLANPTAGTPALLNNTAVGTAFSNTAANWSTGVGVVLNNAILSAEY